MVSPLVSTDSPTRTTPQDAPMDVLTAIATRRSIGKMLPDLPPRQAIEALLDAATRAPNHHRTEPWFFHVITGEMRATLGTVAAEAMQARGAKDASIIKARETFLRAPVVIAVTSATGRNPIETAENRDAVAAAIQNMLLAGTALGLATNWRTGGMVVEPAVRDALGIPPEEEIVGFVHTGYPATAPTPWVPQHHTARSRWWEGGE